MFNFTRGSKERTTIGIDDKKNAKKCVRPCTGACVYVITLYRVDRERERGWMSSSQWLVSISHDISILDSFRSLVFKIFNKHNFRFDNEETKFVVKTYETLRYNSFKHRPLTLSILRNGSFELSCLSIRAIVSKEINLFRWQKRLKRPKRRSRAD